MSPHSYMGGLRATACYHQHRWNSTLRAGSGCEDGRNIGLSDQIASSTLPFSGSSSDPGLVYVIHLKDQQ